jgi:hypothetical protein
MRSAIKLSALLIALGAWVGLVTAQHGAGIHGTVGDDPTNVAIIDDYDQENEITGTVGLASAPRLLLTDEQRALIFLGVINLPEIPELAMRAPEPGVPLPQAIDLHEIPAMVVRRIPEVSDYRFVKLEDRILLVSAETRQVESMIPRYKLVFH